MEIIRSVVELAKSIREQAQNVKAHRSQCATLAKRIERVARTLEGLKKISQSQQFKEALLHLKLHMQSCAAAIEKYCSKTWFKHVFKAGKYKNRFTELNEQLGEAISDLNIGLTAGQVINYDQDATDQAKDWKEISENQNMIIELFKAEFEKRQNVEMKQADRDSILLQQIDAIKSFVKEALRTEEKENKSLIEMRYQIPSFDISFDKKINANERISLFSGFWNYQLVAIKVFKSHLDESEKKQFVREVQIMSRLRSSCLVQFYGACIEPSNSYIVMEYMEQGSLFDLIKQKKILSDQQKCEIALNIARGLGFLHTQNIVHCDIRSNKVLLNKYFIAKLSGFRLSLTQSNSILSLHLSKTIRPQWFAPELLSHVDALPTTWTDIYGYGMVLWELVMGKHLSDKLNTENMIASIPEKVPNVFTRLIKGCLETDPSKRIVLSIIIKELTKFLKLEELYNEGLEYEQKQKYDEARNCYEAAARDGHVKAKTNLGRFYYDGLGGLKNDKQKSYELFVEAAEGGHSRAQFNLAMLLKKGEVVKRDLGKVRFWCKKAADNGFEPAQKELKRQRQSF